MTKRTSLMKSLQKVTVIAITKNYFIAFGGPSHILDPISLCPLSWCPCVRAQMAIVITEVTVDDAMNTVMINSTFLTSLQHEKAAPCFRHTEKLFSSDTRQSMKPRIATET